jgi:hypothetical protein
MGSIRIIMTNYPLCSLFIIEIFLMFLNKNMNIKSSLVNPKKKSLLSSKLLFFLIFGRVYSTNLGVGYSKKFFGLS